MLVQINLSQTFQRHLADAYLAVFVVTGIFTFRSNTNTISIGLARYPMMSGLKERSFSLLLATKCVLINPRGDLANYFLPASAFFCLLRGFAMTFTFSPGVVRQRWGQGNRRVNEDAALLHISCRFIVIILLKRFKLWQPLSCNLFVYCFGQGQARNTHIAALCVPHIAHRSNHPTIHYLLYTIHPLQEATPT